MRRHSAQLLYIRLIDATADRGQRTSESTLPSAQGLSRLSSHLSFACKSTIPSNHVSILTHHSIGCFGLGFILDAKKLAQRRRAQIGLYTVVILNVGVYIWSIIMQVRFKRNDPGAIDWDDGLFATSFLPYFFVQTTGPLSQSYMYWLLSSFATDAQGTLFLLVQLQ